MRPPNVFTAVHLAGDGCVIGVTAANNPREIRAGQALIRSRQPIDRGGAGGSRCAVTKPHPALIPAAPKTCAATAASRGSTSGNYLVSGRLWKQGVEVVCCQNEIR